MAKIYLLCLILMEILLIQAMAGDLERSELSPAPAEARNEEVFGVADAPEIRRLGKHHVDKSVAGGGVIIGGLVTAIFAAVFCYIRVTRKNNGLHTLH